jgi:23S rRNA (uridine2552-2'-O)-methyltransferase
MKNPNDYSKPDFYTDKAKKEGYNARSVYKLQEIDEKYHVFKKGQKVLDLGSCPGSWSQYTLKKIGSNGKVVGIDLKPVTHLSSASFEFILGDIETHQEALVKKAPFDIVLSDMAPNTSGVKSQDAFLSHELSFMALSVASKTLRENGIFICKIFQGDGIDDFFVEIKKVFKKFKSLKPKAVRKNSKEIYVIAFELKNLGINE